MLYTVCQLYRWHLFLVSFSSSSSRCGLICCCPFAYKSCTVSAGAWNAQHNEWRRVDQSVITIPLKTSSYCRSVHCNSLAGSDVAWWRPTRGLRDRFLACWQCCSTVRALVDVLRTGHERCCCGNICHALKSKGKIFMETGRAFTEPRSLVETSCPAPFRLSSRPLPSALIGRARFCAFFHDSCCVVRRSTFVTDAGLVRPRTELVVHWY